MMKTAIFCIIFSCASALTINDKAIPKEGIGHSNHSLQMKQKTNETQKVEVQVMTGASMTAKVTSISEKVRLQAPPKLWHQLEKSGLVELVLKVFNDTEFVKVALKHRHYKNAQVSSVVQTALQNDEFPDSAKMFPNGLDPELKELSEAVKNALGRQISDRELQETQKSLSLMQLSKPDSTFATNNPKMLWALLLPFVLAAYGSQNGESGVFALVVARICMSYVLCVLTGAVGTSTDLASYGVGEAINGYATKVATLPGEWGPFLKSVFMDSVLTGGQCYPYQVWGEISRKGGVNQGIVSKYYAVLSNLATKANDVNQRGAAAYKKFAGTR